MSYDAGDGVFTEMIGTYAADGLSMRGTASTAIPQGALACAWEALRQ